MGNEEHVQRVACTWKASSELCGNWGLWNISHQEMGHREAEEKTSLDGL